jgi:hypothetical protein
MDIFVFMLDKRGKFQFPDSLGGTFANCMVVQGRFEYFSFFFSFFLFLAFLMFIIFLQTLFMSKILNCVLVTKTKMNY